MSRYCMICGHELVLTSNFMRSEVMGDDDLTEEEDSMVTYAECPECGVHYEMTDASEEELGYDEEFVGYCKLWNYKEEENNNENEVQENAGQACSKTSSMDATE